MQVVFRGLQLALALTAIVVSMTGSITNRMSGTYVQCTALYCALEPVVLPEISVLRGCVSAIPRYLNRAVRDPGTAIAFNSANQNPAVGLVKEAFKQ